jgi:hypothetical protein
MYSCLQKTGNCQNKIDTFLQFFHSLTRDRLLWSKFYDILKNYLTGIVKSTIN